MQVKFLLVAVLLAASLKLSDAQCNVCNTTSLTACISVDQFVPCDSSGVLDFSIIRTCAAGSQCNQNLASAPCTPGVTVTCNSNHVQVPPTTTAATTATTTTPTTTSSTTSTTTTTTTTATSTTPLASFSANTYCSSKVAGRYKHPSLSTCVSFVYCYSYNLQMIGAVYTCPLASLFNPSTGYCDPNYSC